MSMIKFEQIAVGMNNSDGIILALDIYGRVWQKRPLVEWELVGNPQEDNEREVED